MKNLMNILMVALLLAACNDEPVGNSNDNTNTNTVAVCGNGVVEAGEECDGNPIVAGPSCQDLGFDSGRVACNADCTFYTDKCAICGDDAAEDQEVCDGADLQHVTCESLGHTGGTLACNADCGGYDESGCTDDPEPAVCGNGIVEAGELCDGTAINDTCQTAGYTGGELHCTANCLTYDASDCWF